MGNFKWDENPDADQLLKTMLQEGARTREVVHALQLRGFEVTRNSVIGRSHRLGVGSMHRPRERQVVRTKAEINAERRDRRAAYKIIDGSRQKHLSKSGFSRAPQPLPTVPPLEEPTMQQTADQQARPRHVPILELFDNGCRYPNGSGPYLFCNAPQAPGSSYCAGHHHLCWQPAKPKEYKEAAE